MVAAVYPGEILTSRLLSAIKAKEANGFSIRLCLLTSTSEKLDRPYVLGLPALWAFGHVELHCLTFLQAPESTGLNGGKMHENVLPCLAADKAIPLGVVEPLNCSLFHILVLLFLFESYVGGSRKKLAQVSCCYRRGCSRP